MVAEIILSNTHLKNTRRASHGKSEPLYEAVENIFKILQETLSSRDLC